MPDGRAALGWASVLALVPAAMALLLIQGHSPQLMGTVLSGWVFQRYGLVACLTVSAGLVAIAALASITLPRNDREYAILSGDDAV